MSRRLSSTAAITTLMVGVFTLLAVAQAAETPARQKVRIKNFGCINETFYRGAQPEKGDYEDLAAMGIKTIIDLQREGEAREQKMVEAAGMKFYRIPMSDNEPPAPEQVAEFLKLVNDPANQPVFIHCKGGRHRTGAMTAVYRMTHDQWAADRAWQEMKQFDFEHGYGHGALKEYVFYYEKQMGRDKAVVVNTGSNK
ncbi:MAG: fused DSP-PTPase phosphatase/NAD kinase-like protein [Blastocatellia bacterium]